MASKEILKQKEAVVSEISNKIDNAKTFLLLDYQGLKVTEVAELRRKLREVNSDIKVYKNTLMNIALKNKNINLDDYMEGPNAYLFADSIIEPIKIVSKFAKEHPALEIRVGCIDSEIVDLKTINEYATIPSMEGLLTMFAGGLMEHVRNLSIGLNLYAEKLEEGGNN
ncbi:MAG: 50S ribosomal protein L10 [Tenericutes bacterium]|nr:50S ribosomal protein L10 [Mycoplasmatota bacterium]